MFKMGMKVVHEISHRDFKDLVIVSLSKAAMYLNVEFEDLTVSEFTDWLEELPDNETMQLLRS